MFLRGLTASLLLLASAGLPLTTQDADCEGDAEASGGGLIVEGSCDTPGYGEDPRDGTNPPTEGDAHGSTDPFFRVFEENPCNPHEDTASECAHNGYILLPPADSDDPEDPDDPGEVREITINDVVRFAPDGPNIVVEPEGWGLVGKPVNVFSDSGEQTTNGEILGMPVTIVWIPVSLTIDYGDGTVVTTDGQGSEWSDSEFMTETATSHSYTESGDYVISGVIEYAPRVHINGVEVIVRGTVAVDTNSVSVSIYWVKTRLTQP